MEVAIRYGATIVFTQGTFAMEIYFAGDPIGLDEDLKQLEASNSQSIRIHPRKEANAQLSPVTVEFSPLYEVLDIKKAIEKIVKKHVKSGGIHFLQREAKTTSQVGLAFGR